MIKVPKRRAKPSGVFLTPDDAAIAKGMLRRGDRQHDIAAWFGVNGGRIAEIASGDRFEWVSAQLSDLPPVGPYPNGKQSLQAKAALEKAQAALIDAQAAIMALTKSGA